MAIKMKITQIKSGIGCAETQQRTLAGLGLGKLNRSVVLADTLAIRGMVRKVSHLIVVEPVE